MVADDQRSSDEPERAADGSVSEAAAETAGADIADSANESSPQDVTEPQEQAPVSDADAAGNEVASGADKDASDSGPRQVVDAASGIVLDVAEDESDEDEPRMEWYILKVQVNREDSIRDALLRRIKIEGLEEYFTDVVVPVEELAEFTKTGKRRIVKRKLYPGYILVHMVINDDTWFVVRETPGVGDFTGSAGKPTPMETREVERILRLGAPQEDGAAPVKTSIPFRQGDRVRVKDGNFQNFEGEVDTIDEANGRIVVIINIFNRSTPVELEHWQVEAV
jgi:transcriptional antiterminator NusG